MKVKCDILARVVGYYRAVKLWNPGQKQQWNDRNLISLKGLAK